MLNSACCVINSAVCVYSLSEGQCRADKGVKDQKIQEDYH